MYNEKLVRNQDNELNARIRSSGGRIYLTSALSTRYSPPARFRQLLRQTFINAKWHFFTVRQYPPSMSARHFVPALFVLALSASMIAAINGSRVWLWLLLATYLFCASAFALARSSTDGSAVAVVFPLAALCFHVAYGAGTLSGLPYLFITPSLEPIRPGLPIARTPPAPGD
jgi:hypothetical protein